MQTFQQQRIRVRSAVPAERQRRFLQSSRCSSAASDAVLKRCSRGLCLCSPTPESRTGKGGLPYESKPPHEVLLGSPSPARIEVPWFRLEILMHHLDLQRLIQVSGARLDGNTPRQLLRHPKMLFMHKVCLLPSPFCPLARGHAELQKSCPKSPVRWPPPTHFS